MEHKFDPTEQLAWEVFVQIVGNGRCASHDKAAEAAFDAVESFEMACNQHRESKKSKRSEEQSSSEGQESAKLQSSEPLPFGVLGSHQKPKQPTVHTQKPDRPVSEKELPFGKA
jgi:hypothetical protein